MVMRMMVVVMMVTKIKIIWFRLWVAVRSDHSIKNGDEDGNGAGQDYMVGSEWCCRTCGVKRRPRKS